MPLFGTPLYEISPPLNNYLLDDREFELEEFEFVDAVSDREKLYVRLSEQTPAVLAVLDYIVKDVLNSFPVGVVGLARNKQDLQNALKKIKNGHLIEYHISMVYGLKLIDWAHSRGFLIMGTGLTNRFPWSRSVNANHQEKIHFLVFKYHDERSVIPLHNRQDGLDLFRDCLHIDEVPHGLAEDESWRGLPVIHACHVKQARKGNLRLYVNRNCAKCIQCCGTEHESSWVHDALARMYRAWCRVGGYSPRELNTRLISVEVYRGDELVAGEIGVVYSTMYTSLSGFHLEKNAGMIQLLSWFCVLLKRGFEIWDFGQVMDYKSRMGACVVRSGGWAKIVNHCSNKQTAPPNYSVDSNGIDCAACLSEYYHRRRQVQKND